MSIIEKIRGLLPENFSTQVIPNIFSSETKISSLGPNQKEHYLGMKAFLQSMLDCAKEFETKYNLRETCHLQNSCLGVAHLSSSPDATGVIKASFYNEALKIYWDLNDKPHRCYINGPGGANFPETLDKIAEIAAEEFFNIMNKDRDVFSHTTGERTGDTRPSEQKAALMEKVSDMEVIRTEINGMFTKAKDDFVEKLKNGVDNDLFDKPTREAA